MDDWLRYNKKIVVQTKKSLEKPVSLSVSVEKISGRRGVLRRSGVVGGSALLAGGAAGSALLMSLFASPVGAATTFTVDTNADGAGEGSDCTTPVASSCSLRDALAAADTDGDIIVFDAALSGQTISLSEGQLVVDVGLTITGLGSANLTIDAGNNSRVFYIYTETSGVEVAISGLSIINGDAGSNYGGGIYDLHDGDLTLNDVSVTGCVANYGGGIYVDDFDGTVEIVDSTISDNYASSSGGGLYTDGPGDLIITNSTFDNNTADDGGGAGTFGSDGDVTITGSTFSDNTSDGEGGAIYLESGVTDVSISGSTFSGNDSSSSGGAIYATNGGSLTVTSSSFSGNTSDNGGGAIYAANDGSLTVASSTFSGNVSDSWGGALYLGTDGQEITVNDSLFADNVAVSGGGALDFDANNQIVTINNSTVVGNTSNGDGVEGGGIWKDQGGSLTITMSTITENSAAKGGGIFFQAPEAGQADLTIIGTILAGNTATGGAADDLNTDDKPFSPAATISDSVLGVVDADITVTASNNIDATAPGFVLGLDALADNGGATETMALLAGSPAIDAGPAPVPTFTGNGFDQRGTPYVRVYNSQSDIGAFELQPDPTPATTTTTGAVTPTTGAVTPTTVASDEPVVKLQTGPSTHVPPILESTCQ